MKNIFKLFPVIIATIIIGFSMTACDTGTTDLGGTPQTYTVTFNLNGGSGTAPGKQAVNAGSGITLPSGSGITKSGYIFGGWNTNASGTGSNYPAGSSYTPSASITLYAKWNVSLSAPVILTATTTYGIPVITWAKVPGADGYIVYRNDVNMSFQTSPFTDLWATTSPPTACTYVVYAYVWGVPGIILGPPSLPVTVTATIYY